MLNYVAQLLPLPDDALKIEKHALHSITHMATNSLRFTDFFGFSDYGAPKFRCIQAQAHAALTRASITVVPHWPFWRKQLQAAANVALPLADGAQGRLSPKFWDNEPIAEHLGRAYFGFYGSASARLASTAALKHMVIVSLKILRI